MVRHAHSVLIEGDSSSPGKIWATYVVAQSELENGQLALGAEELRLLTRLGRTGTTAIRDE